MSRLILGISCKHLYHTMRTSVPMELSDTQHKGEQVDKRSLLHKEMEIRTTNN
jgi:hypothetical protein